MKSLRLLALILSVAFAFSIDASAAERPNILFLFADDWGEQAGVYSRIEGKGGISDVAVTPNIDSVARQGVTFTNAFVNAPSCTPCRSSILSGQYFYRTGRGAILQGAVWDPKIPTYPLLLEKNGYHIGYTYKVWSPGTPRDAGYGGDKNAYRSAGGQFNGFSQHAMRLIKSGKSVKEAKEQLLQQPVGNFEAFLADREDNQPFCYWFGPTNVHRKWIAGSGKKLWGINPDSLKGKLPPFLPDTHVVRQDMADYLGEIAAFDAAVGLLLKKLEEKGLAENTLVVISGDHGPPGFTNGKCNLYDFGTNVPLIARWPGQIPEDRVVTDFTTLMDLAPTFLEAGGVEIPDVMTGRSLFPVMTSQKAGQVDTSRDSVVTGRERHVAQARAGQLPYPQRAIRTRDYLYIINFKPDRWPMGDPGEVTDKSTPSTDTLTNETFAAFADMDASPTKAWIIEHRDDKNTRPFYDYAFAKRPREELYILKHDPHQIRNVAGKEDYKEIQQELNQKLLGILRETDDPRVIEDPVPFEHPPSAGNGN